MDTDEDLDLHSWNGRDVQLPGCRLQLAQELTLVYKCRPTFSRRLTRKRRLDSLIGCSTLYVLPINISSSHGRIKLGLGIRLFPRRLIHAEVTERNQKQPARM